MPKRILDVANIEIRHLRYFLTVADERHFSRAAEKLGIAQPPLSQQIQRLEELVGQRLFDRRPQVRLTPAGEVLADSARRLIQQLQQDLEEARRTGAGYAGSLSVGFPASALLTFFPSVVRQFTEAHPDVSLSLREMSSAAQLEALQDGSIEIGVLRGTVSDERFFSEVVIEEPFVAVIWDGHPLCARESISLADLANDAFILFPRSVAPAVHDDISAIFREASVEPTIIMEALEWLTIIGLVQSGIGVSIAPASFQRLNWGDVHYVSLTGISIQTSISICMEKRNASKAASNFLQLMCKARDTDKSA